MPVDAALIASGARPRQSPRSTEVNDPWTMRFAAGLGDGMPELLDTRLGPLLVHPCFMPGALENPSMFLSVYAVGVTNREASAVVHASIDSLLGPATLRSGDTLVTTFGVVAAAPRRAGAELTTQIEHSVGGETVCRSRWGCVILGQQLGDDELASISKLPPWPAVPSATSDGTAAVRTRVLRIEPTAAHVWEACIQDPTHARRLSEMISPHTDARVAERAGFPARTLTGVCLLARAVSELSRTLGFSLAAVRRVTASFAAPVYIDTDPVDLLLRFWPSTSLPAGRSALFFEVRLPEQDDGSSKDAIRSGYIEWEEGLPGPGADAGGSGPTGKL